MEKIKSHFVFNNQQRNGILFLILLISGLLYVFFFVSFSKDKALDVNTSEILVIQKKIDSLKKAKIASRKPKIYPFNPNFITDYKGYTLGMSSEEINRLKKFRNEDKWINSSKDFQKVTKISDSLLTKISPYFKFPDWVSNPKSKKQNNYKAFKEKPFAQKTDLNIATAEQLRQVSGIGPALSKRIITYREKLEGFTADSQLYNVYGLDYQVVRSALKIFTVKTPKKITKININNASASDIATIPGISFSLAKEIWEYRILREQVKDFSELENIDGMTQRKLTGILLYLTLE